jgi:hypothetical protein
MSAKTERLNENDELHEFFFAILWQLPSGVDSQCVLQWKNSRSLMIERCVFPAQVGKNKWRLGKFAVLKF